MSYSHSSFPSAAGTATSAVALVPRRPHHRLAFAGPALPPHIPLHANAKSKGQKCGGQNISPSLSLFDLEPPARNDCYERHSRCRRNNNMFMSYSSLSSDDADIPSFSDDANDDNDGTETGVLDEESAVVDTGYASEAVEALDDAALAGGGGEGDDDEKGRMYEDSDDIYAGEEGVMFGFSGLEEDYDDDDSYFDDEEDEDEDEDEDGVEFDELALDELDFFDDEQEAILNELELAEDLGMLDDDEFLIKVDDDLVIKARRSGTASAGETGNDDKDDDIVGGGDGDIFLMEEFELAGAFDEDGKDYRAIDDDTLLEILGLPDEEVIGGLDEALALEGEEEIIFQATDKDLKKAKQYFDDVFEEQSRAKTKENQLEEPSKDKGDDITPQFSFQPLESALELGVVPTEAGVGSGALPGDFGFDPFGFSEKDWFKQSQRALLSIVPERKYEEDEESPAGQEESGYDGGAIPKSLRVKTFDDMEKRPASLIIRDYREAEIRHGRLAMLAAIFWPLQELVDRVFLPESFGHTTFVYGGPTLPFFPLLMTFIMLNLGYLDIFASEIKKEEAGDAFEPGDVFWDPLAILQDAPPSMRRNFQQRELFNGRIAMLAVACFIFEEALTHKPLIEGRISQFLFEPAYEVPEIQAFFDSLFGSQGASPVFVEPDGAFNPIQVLLEEEADKAVEAELSGGGTPVISQSQSTLESFSMKYNK